MRRGHHIEARALRRRVSPVTGHYVRERRDVRASPAMRRRGFTLPEILSALTLLVVGAFSSFALLALSIECDKEAADFSAARTIATTQFETLRASQNRPAAGTTTIAGVTTQLGSPATGTMVVTHEETTGQTALDLVTVTLTWREPGRGTVTLTNSTYICSGGVSAS